MRYLMLGIIVAMTWPITWPSAQQPAADAHPDPGELVKEARTLNADGRREEALSLYERALQIDPTFFDAHLGAGMALDLSGDHLAARRHLEKAIEFAAEGDEPRALSAMGVSFAFEGKADEAAPFYQRLFDERSAAGELAAAAATANALARVYLESGDSDNAERWYQTGYETARQIPDLTSEQADLWSMRWHHAQGRIAARRGRFDEAKRQAADLKSLIDKGGPNAQQLPIYHYLLGYIAFYARDYDRAVAVLLEGDLQDPFILVLIAQAYDKNGDRVKAREYYQQVLASNAHTLQNAFSRPIAKKRLRQLG
jgi:tetratricopeptide (TPR) repeat protein